LYRSMLIWSLLRFRPQAYHLDCCILDFCTEDAFLHYTLLYSQHVFLREDTCFVVPRTQGKHGAAGGLSDAVTPAEAPRRQPWRRVLSLPGRRRHPAVVQPLWRRVVAVAASAAAAPSAGGPPAQPQRRTPPRRGGRHGKPLWLVLIVAPLVLSDHMAEQCRDASAACPAYVAALSVIATRLLDQPAKFACMICLTACASQSCH